MPLNSGLFFSREDSFSSSSSIAFSASGGISCEPSCGVKTERHEVSVRDSRQHSAGEHRTACTLVKGMFFPA